MRSQGRFVTLLNYEFVRYVSIGGVAFIVDVSLLATLMWAGLPYLAAAIVAFSFGTWVNYRLSVRWVFTFRAIDTSSVEFGLFLLVGLVTLTASLGLMALLVEQFGIHVLLAKCAVTTFTLICNFGARRALLFTPWRRSSTVSSVR